MSFRPTALKGTTIRGERSTHKIAVSSRRSREVSNAREWVPATSQITCRLLPTQLNQCLACLVLILVAFFDPVGMTPAPGLGNELESSQQQQEQQQQQLQRRGRGEGSYWNATVAFPSLGSSALHFQLLPEWNGWAAEKRILVGTATTSSAPTEPHPRVAANAANNGDGATPPRTSWRSDDSAPFSVQKMFSSPPSSQAAHPVRPPDTANGGGDTSESSYQPTGNLSQSRHSQLSSPSLNGEDRSVPREVQAGPWPWAPAPIRHWWAQHRRQRPVAPSTTFIPSERPPPMVRRVARQPQPPDPPWPPYPPPATEQSQPKPPVAAPQQCLRYLHQEPPPPRLLLLRDGPSWARRACAEPALDARVRALLAASPCVAHRVCQVLSPADLRGIASDAPTCIRAAEHWWRLFHVVSKALVEFDAIFTTSLDIHRFSVMYDVAECKVRKTKLRPSIKL